jgi:hypothetical protein
LGRPVATDAHPKHAIALGAAIAAAAAVGGRSTADMAAVASVVATPEEPVVSRTVSSGAAVLAGWLPDPTSRHEYRYWDGGDWTADVSDAGVAATDPMPAPAPVAATPARAPEPTPDRASTASTRSRRNSRLPVIVAAGVVVVLLVGFLVTRGGGGGGGSAGLGTTKGNVPANGVFIHHVEVPANSVLLVKAIPEGSFDLVLSLAADFPTIEKYKNNFGATNFGRGAAKIDSSDSTFGALDLSTVKGGIFHTVNAGFGEGVAEQIAVPAPSPVGLDIVVTALKGGSGDITLQLVTKKFVGPSTVDKGTFYVALMGQAYERFLDGSAEINDTTDFTRQADYTDNTDFSRFSSQFSSLDSLPK